MLKSYKYRIYPDDEQKVLLTKHFGCVRWMYNYGLATKTKAFKDKIKLTHLDIANQIPRLKETPETNWLKEVNAQSLQMALRNLDNAYTKFFREKKGFPKFKRKNDNNQSFQCPQRCSVDFKANCLYIPKFRSGIKAIFHREFIGEICNVTISRNCSNQYFASILVENSIPIPERAPVKNAIGIDLGIKELAVLSDGRKFSVPKFLLDKKLKRLQKSFSHKKKGSKNRERVRIKVAKCHQKIVNKRKDFLHKLSRELINDNQVDTFCLETLNVVGMMANHKLAKSIGNASWSSFVSYLTYKAEWAGKNVIKIGRFEPSSKVCSSCGRIKPMPLDVRIYECKCGYIEDRDVNAAKNIRNFALLMNRNLGEDFAPMSVEVSKAKSRKAKKLTRVRQRAVEAEKSCCEAGIF